MMGLGGWELALLFLAGVGGGLTGSIAGLASVSTYPALLAVGLPPVTANVTNTVALVFNGIGSVWGSLPELAGQRATVLRLVPLAAVGGVAGAVLLLSIPPSGFENVVPALLAASAVVIALPRRTRVEETSSRTRVAWTGAAVLAICVYGGFFGAAAGVLLLALLLGSTASLPRANAAKNVILGVSNGVAAVVFAFFAPVHWLAMVPMALGCLLGSRLGPIVVRHAPATALRILIALGALALAVDLGLQTYR